MRDSGGCITTTAWSTEQGMLSSDQQVAPLRDRAMQIFGDRPEVRQWEIAVLHRARRSGEGACARVTWTRLDPAQVDHQLYAFRIGTLPQLEDLPGFCGASLLLDRRSGTAALAVTYESRDALSAGREAAVDLRVSATTEMGVRVLDVAEFEVAVAHLRVPETV